MTTDLARLERDSPPEHNTDQPILLRAWHGSQRTNLVSVPSIRCAPERFRLRKVAEAAIMARNVNIPAETSRDGGDVTAAV